MALTPAQKQKAYRERQKLKPDQPKSVYFHLKGSLVDDLDYVANIFEKSRTAIAQDIIRGSLRTMLPAIKDAAKEMEKKIAEFPEASEETIKKVKQKHWDIYKAALDS